MELIGLSGENISGQSGRGLVVRRKKYIWEIVTLLSLAIDHEQKQLHLQATKNRFIFGGMSAKPTAPPRFRLTDDEWDKMTKRRKEEMVKQKNRLSFFEDQPEAEYKKMVEALLDGKEAWKIWQDWHEKNPSLSFYNFQYLDFFRVILLDGVEFTKAVSFEEATFGNGAYFGKTTFAEGADFSKTRFTEDANFHYAIFKRYAIFNIAKFDQEAYFFGAIFTSQAYFFGATFTKKAYFFRAEFTEGVSFNKATFTKEASFNHTAFQKSSFFNEARFYEKAIDFNEVILSPDSNLILAGTEFYHNVPDFRYLTRTPHIRFHNFSVPAPNKLESKYIWDHYNEDRYRKLKELAIGNDNHEYELKFYGYEMDSKLINFYRSKENYNKKWWKFLNKKLREICHKKLWKFYNKKWWKFCHKKLWIFFNKKWWKFCHKKCWVDILPTCLYKHLSNYGQSVWRPFFGLIVLAIIYHNRDLDWNAIFQPILSLLPFINNVDWFATTKTILPLPLFTFTHNVDSYEPIDNFGLLIKIPATILWFLLFLAVRNKFKIK